MMEDEFVDEAAEEKRLDKQRSLKIATQSLAWSSLSTAFASTTSVAMAVSALRFNFSDLMTSNVSISLSPAFVAILCDSDA
jgi:hypothetical protein